MGVTRCKVLPKVPLNARNDSHFIFVVLNGLRSVVAAAVAAATVLLPPLLRIRTQVYRIIKLNTSLEN